MVLSRSRLFGDTRIAVGYNTCDSAGDFAIRTDTKVAGPKLGSLSQAFSFCVGFFLGSQPS